MPNKKIILRRLRLDRRWLEWIINNITNAKEGILLKDLEEEEKIDKDISNTKIKEKA